MERDVEADKRAEAPERPPDGYTMLVHGSCFDCKRGFPIAVDGFAQKVMLAGAGTITATCPKCKKELKLIPGEEWLVICGQLFAQEARRAAQALGGKSGGHHAPII